MASCCSRNASVILSLRFPRSVWRSRATDSSSELMERRVICGAPPLRSVSATDDSVRVVRDCGVLPRSVWSDDEATVNGELGVSPPSSAARAAVSSSGISSMLTVGVTAGAGGAAGCSPVCWLRALARVTRVDIARDMQG